MFVYNKHFLEQSDDTALVNHTSGNLSNHHGVEHTFDYVEPFVGVSQLDDVPNLLLQSQDIRKSSY